MKSFYKLFTASLAVSALAFAQTAPAGAGGWPRASANSPTSYAASPYQDQDQPAQTNQGQINQGQINQDQDAPPPPQDNRQYPARPQYGSRAQNPPQQPLPPVPAQLTIVPGTYVTVRVNQFLSTDRNQKGDAFSATLVQPIVVNGVVVAEPGETLGGQIVESQKAGRVEGTARLGIQLTELTLVDGQQVPIQSQFIARSGDTSIGRDAGAIAATTGVGAAIGAGVSGGAGAAVGAGAGLLVSAIGVLVTRGHPSVIYPEQALTFRIQAPVAISTENAPMAFRYVQPNEYDNSNYNREELATRPAYASVAPAPPPPYYYGYPSYYGYGYGYGYPYYWGPSIGFYFGGGRGYYGGYRGGYRSGGYYHGGGGGYRGGGGGHGGGHGRH